MRISILFFLITLIGSYYFAELRLGPHRLTTEYSKVRYESLMSGEAPAPFRYRILIPHLVHHVSTRWTVPPEKLFFLIEFSATALLVLAFKIYLNLYFQRRTAMALALTLLYVLPFNYLFPRNMTFIYPYDIPGVLFMTLGIYLIYRKKWLVFYPFFVLATMNRETTCFLSMIYLLTYWKIDSHMHKAGHLIAQFLLWSSVKYGVTLLLPPSHHTRLFELGHIEENLERFLFNFSDYPLFLSTYGFLWLFAIAGYCYIENSFARRALLVMVPFLLGMFIVGNLYETRIYGDMIPVVLPAAFLAIRGMTKQPKPPPFPGSSR